MIIKDGNDLKREYFPCEPMQGAQGLRRPALAAPRVRAPMLVWSTVKDRGGSSSKVMPAGHKPRNRSAG